MADRDRQDPDDPMDREEIEGSLDEDLDEVDADEEDQDEDDAVDEDRASIDRPSER